MSVWNLRESIGFPSTISMNSTAKSFWHILNTSRRFDERKPTRRTLNRLLTFQNDLVSEVFIPPADIRQLRDLIRYHTQLTSFTTGEKNHAQNCLTVSDLKLDSVFSDVFNKTSSNIIGQILANPSEKLSDVSAF